MSDQKLDMNVLAPAPIRTPFLGSDGLISAPWVLYFQKLNTRVGGAYSQTVNQITENVTNIQNTTITTDLLSESGTGEDYGDAVEELARLAYMQPAIGREEAENSIPPISQNIEYETGVWTPTYNAGVTTTGTVVSTGNYTKIGNLLFWDAFIDATAGSFTAAGGHITNLPYSSANIAIFNFWSSLFSTSPRVGVTTGTTGIFTDFTITNSTVIASGRFLWQ